MSLRASSPRLKSSKAGSTIPAENHDKPDIRTLRRLLGGADETSSSGQIAQCNCARIWDPATGALERTLTGHTGWVNAVCPVQLDGRELLASASNDQTVRIWDLLTNAPESILQGHTDRVNSVCVIQIGGRALLASASDDQTIRIWDPATGHSLYEIPVHYEALKLALLRNRHLIIGLSIGLLALALS